MKEKQDPPGIFYFWRGERPLHPKAPQLHGTGEIKLESAERGAGYFTTLSETQLEVNAKTSGVYLRADPEDLGILNGRDDRKRAKLIAERLKHWKGIKSLDRKSVVSGKSVSLRVDLGGRRIIKKQKSRSEDIP